MTLLSVLIVRVHADDQPAEREEYLAQQKRMTQETREISDNLLSQLKPLTGAEEDTFSNVMRYGTRVSEPDFEILKAGLRAEFFQATDPKLKSNQQGLRILKQHLQNRIIGNAAVGIRGAGAKEEFRRLVCEESLKVLKELLSNNHAARFVAITLLPELQPVNPPNLGDPRRQILDEAATTLADILMDENQPDTVKLIAAYSMSVYLDRVASSGTIQIKLARALISELDSWMPADGYQLQLLETLSRIQAPREVAGVERKAIIFDALASVMQDKRRSYLIRCRAAGALGSVGFDAGIKFDPLAWKVAQLAAEVSRGYEDQPAAPHWDKCGEQLFLAFRGTNGDGMLNRAPRSDVVREAYAKVLPLAAGLILLNDIDESLITDAETWAAENVPEVLSYDGASPPLQP